MGVPKRLRTRPRSPKEFGQALVEFVIILPVFLLLLVIAIDAGRLFYSYIEINNAAREGAAFAASNPSDTNKITAAVGRETNSQGAGSGTVPVTTVSCADQVGATIACTAASGGAGIGNSVKVVVSKPFKFFTPILSNFFGGDLPMSSSATSIVLGFAASPTATNPAGCSPPTSATFTLVVNGKDVSVNPSASQPSSGICAISGYNWEWGDGNSEAGAAVASSHTYASNGTYTITLTVTNQGGELIKPQNVTIGAAPSASPSASPSSSPSASPSIAPCTKPVANFIILSKTGRTYSYKDTSTVADSLNCPITAWFWAFDDGTVDNSNAISPVHKYTGNGSDKATLTVTNSAGSSTVGPK